jgi:hypothetical protein
MTARVGFAVSEGRLLVDIDGAQADADSGLRQLGRLLLDTSATARRLESELPAALAARDSAALGHSRASQFPLSGLMPGRASRLRPLLDTAEATLQELAGQRNACAVKLRFVLGEAALDAFARLAAAHTLLARSARIWAVPDGQVADTMTTAPPRVAVTAKPLVPDLMVSRWPGLAFQDRDGVGVALFPGFVMAQRPGAGGSLLLTDIMAATVEAGEVRLPEREALPPDAAVVGQTWERTNRDGSPDRRYANNTRIPVVAYGRLRLALGPGERRAFLVSDRAAAVTFAEAFKSFQAALRAVPPAPAGDSQGRDAWPEAGPDPVVRVPPPPRASPAHEVTAALAVAVGLVGWSLSGLQANSLLASPPAPLASIAPEPTQPVPPPAGPARPEPAREHVPPPAVQVPAPAVPQPTPPAESEAAAAVAPPAAQRREQIVTRTGANVRAAPSGAAEVVRTVPAAIRMSVFARAPGGWVQVGDTAPWGWVHSSLLDAVE